MAAQINQVRINAGGKIFDTTKSTLLGESCGGKMKSDEMTFFSSMLSGNYPLKIDNGVAHIFLDKDPDSFRIILKWLRGEAIDWAKMEEIEFQNLYMNIQYYQLRSMEKEGLIARGHLDSNYYPDPKCFTVEVAETRTHRAPVYPIKSTEDPDIVLSKIAIHGVSLVEKMYYSLKTCYTEEEFFNAESIHLSTTGQRVNEFASWYDKDLYPDLESKFKAQVGDHCERYKLKRRDPITPHWRDKWLKTLKLKFTPIEASHIKFYRDDELIDFKETFDLFGDRDHSATITISPKCWWTNKELYGFSFSIKQIQFHTRIAPEMKKRKLDLDDDCSANQISQ